MPAQKKPATQPLVMIIDDDATTRMIASQFLSQSGFRVADAEDGHRALNVIDEIRPDLILLDVEMPGLNGFEVCESLRKNPAFGLTPILMLTGLENDETIDRAFIAGATDFATKPISWSLLSHRLRYIHRASMLAAQLIREQDSLAAAQRIAQLGNWQFDYLTGKSEWSDQLFRIFGLSPDHVTPSPAIMLKFVDEGDLPRVSTWFKNAKLLTAPSSIDHQIKLLDGSVRSVRQQVEPEFDLDGHVIRLQAIVQDFTEQRLIENRVKQLAYYDTLTELPNRTLFQERLESAMHDAHKQSTQLAILYFDLDDFKRVNDTFGHAVGDKLLQEVGVRLNKSLRTSPDADQKYLQSNTIARMGGDEFTIVLTNIKNSEDAEKIAKRIIDVISQPFQLDGYELYSSPSIGIALYPKDGDCADTLLKNADMAMYEAKRVGKNIYKIHDAQMDERAAKHYKIYTQMRMALERNEFSLVYQPQLDLISGSVYSVEALLRWNNKSLGIVPPDEFIPAAEDNGLIIPIGEWVLRTACAQAKKWMDDGFAIDAVAVNISALQFMRSDFPSVVCQALEDTGLPPASLELEITESLLASDINHAVNTLKRLNDIGVILSIDDFGTGYSSLSQLKNFPIDRLKIDQSFIRNVTDNLDDAAITRAVIAMACSMNIKVLAEGVETHAQLDFLRENHCDEIQGYYISKPRTAAVIEQEMRDLQNRLANIFNNNLDAPLEKAS